MFRFFLSWRYLFARRTNLIGMVGILVAVGALILILSIMTGFLEESRRVVRGALADVVVQPFQVASDLDTPGDDVTPLLEAVDEDPRVAGCAAQLVWGGIVGQRGHSFSRTMANASQPGRNPLIVQIVGVDVAGDLRLGRPLLETAASVLGGRVPIGRSRDELTATEFLPSLLPIGDRPPTDPVAHPLFPFQPPPEYQPRGRPKAGIIVGDQLYRGLGLERGELIQLATLVVDPATGEPLVNNREFVVCGSFRTGENDTDTSRVYLDRRELSDFIGGTQEYTQVLARLHDYDRDGDAVVRDLRAALADRELISGGSAAIDEVRTWEEFRGNLLGAIENERVLMGIMLSLVLVVAGFTIFAILSMMVTEKRRDIGILLALGATPRGILDLFLCIAWWDAVLGASLGAVLGTWGALRIDSIERALSSALGIQIFDRDVYLFDHIPSIVEATSVATIVVFAFGCALLFAAFPAWRAARLDPLEALRYE